MKIFYIFLLCLSYSSFSLQAGKIYDILEEYSEERFRILAKEGVLLVFDEKKLPLPDTENYQEEHRKIFKEEYQLILENYKKEWIHNSLNRLELLVNQRLIILHPFLNQLDIARNIAEESKKAKINKIFEFIFKKCEDLKYVIEGYVPEVLPNQARIDNNMGFPKSISPFETYVRFTQEEKNSNAHNYAIKKFIIYKGMAKFLNENNLTFSLGTAKILDNLLLKMTNRYFVEQIEAQKDLMLTKYRSNIDPTLNLINKEALRPEYLNGTTKIFNSSAGVVPLKNYFDPLIKANSNFLSSSNEFQISPLESFKDLYRSNETIEHWLKIQTTKWLNRTDFYE